MNHLIVAHFQSSDTPAQASAAQILQAQTGGILLKAGPFDANGNRLANALTESAFALEDHYCTMMTHRRGGIIDVTLEERQSMTRFIRERRSILSELKTIIVTVSPEAESQNIAVETLTAICEAGVPPSDIRILFTEVPANSGFEDIYPRVSEYARQSEISLIPDAALPASTSFAKAQHFKLPIAAVLNLAIDFETELTAARLNGAPEKVMHSLAHKVIAQRDLLASANTFNRMANALGLPCISQEDWREEFPMNTNRKRTKAAVIE
ncbi:hypothetical protein [Paraburkholderia tropica]|uniref:hypothetical protein n=1 Tax=Paraburkholderia tropica TaxID=92647 RepID=UPI003D2878AC